MKKKWYAVILALTCLGLATVLYFGNPASQLPTSLDQEDLATPFPTTQAPSIPETLTLVFTGDAMLDRNIRLRAQQRGYDFLIGPQLKELLLSADYAITNLEGPVTENPSISLGSEVGSSRNFIFTFEPESLQFLKNHNITIVNLGNNHILNFGEDGLSETYQHLAEAGLLYFGYTGTSQPTKSSMYVLETAQGSIGFVNYNQFIAGGEDQAFADITNLRDEVDYLIMYTHWGNEYVQENQVLVSLAHRFIDEGVDMVIGSHPHVVTGHEVYKEKHIYYSLGNFIFDQYFEPAVRSGLVVTTIINPKTKSTVVTEHRVELHPSGQTELVQ